MFRESVHIVVVTIRESAHVVIVMIRELVHFVVVMIRESVHVAGFIFREMDSLNQHTKAGYFYQTGRRPAPRGAAPSSARCYPLPPKSSPFPLFLQHLFMFHLSLKKGHFGA